jgi:hypothetical protein
MLTMMPPVPVLLVPPPSCDSSRFTPAGLQAINHARTPMHGPMSRVTRQRM